MAANSEAIDWDYARKYYTNNEQAWENFLKRKIEQEVIDSTLKWMKKPETSALIEKLEGHLKEAVNTAVMEHEVDKDVVKFIKEVRQPYQQTVAEIGKGVDALPKVNEVLLLSLQDRYNKMAAAFKQGGSSATGQVAKDIQKWKELEREVGQKTFRRAVLNGSLSWSNFITKADKKAVKKIASKMPKRSLPVKPRQLYYGFLVYSVVYTVVTAVPMLIPE